jgi:hypothetical protein
MWRYAQNGTIYCKVVVQKMMYNPINMGKYFTNIFPPFPAEGIVLLGV